MNRKRNIAIAVATALGVGLVLNSGVLAHGPGYSYGAGHLMGGHGHGRGMHRAMTYGDHMPAGGHQHGIGPVWTLDLTDEQRAEIGKIHDSLRKQHWELRGKLQEQYSKLENLNAATTVDKAAIDAVYDEIFKLRRQLVQTSTDARAETAKLLSDEQRKTFAGWRRGGPGPCVTFDRQS